MVIEYNLKYNFSTDMVFRVVRGTFIDWVLEMSGDRTIDFFMNNDWVMPSEWTTYDGQIFMCDFKVGGIIESAKVETYETYLRVDISINDPRFKEFLNESLKDLIV